MESTQPQLICASEFAPVTDERATPFSQQTVVLTKQDYSELKWEAHYWRAQHARLVEREAALKAQVEALEAKVRDLNQRFHACLQESMSIFILNEISGFTSKSRKVSAIP